MFGLMDRIDNGVEPMLADLEAYITQSGVDDMKASAEIITTVSHSKLSATVTVVPAVSFSGVCVTQHLIFIPPGLREVCGAVVSSVQEV